MLGYHLFIAWKSIRRTPKHSLLIIAGIALGVAVATLFSTVRHTLAKDPIPEKSGSLYYVQLDNWPPGEPREHDGVPPLLTYPDMIGIMKSNIPIRQTAAFLTALRISAGTGTEPARQEWTRVCHADFFEMFGLPFRYGSGWSREADEKAEPLVVIDDELNHRLFAGENSVGRTVRVGDRDFRVAGVLLPFRPSIRYYDLTLGKDTTVLPERIFISMGHILPMEIQTWGRRLGGLLGKKTKKGFERSLEAENCFLQMWVELPGPAELEAYHSFLDAYAIEQRQFGRFLGPIDNRLTPLLDYMRERNCPPPEATAMMITANLFLFACGLSLMGLLLSRFLARGAEIGVRRALGARRWDIFLQHVIECEMVALAGGLLGFALASAFLWLINLWFKTHVWGNRDDIFRMDLTMTGFAVAVSLLAGLLAGIYPAYRVCRVPPASHLKIQ